MVKAIAIVRLRGRTGRNYHIEHTLKLLKLHKPNHAVVYQESESLYGMLQKVKDTVTWGEINSDTLEHLIVKRGELQGKNRINNKHIKESTQYATIKQFTKAVLKGEAKIKDVSDLQPVFRLSPPRKGFKSLKNPVNRRGDLGYRGEAINELIARMA
ncbi:MAG: 50S ribosomal protein L30 [Candidatus Heimdallarchaeota archaeon]